VDVRDVGYGTRNEARDHELRGLVRELTDEVSTLVRQEVALARAELRDKQKVVAGSAASLTIGGVMLFGGFLALLCCAIAALGLVLPIWASALIIGAGVLCIGAVMVFGGLAKLKRTSFKPERAMREARNTLHMMKEQFR
jgi:hypothetical protein